MTFSICVFSILCRKQTSFKCTVFFLPFVFYNIVSVNIMYVFEVIKNSVNIHLQSFAKIYKNSMGEFLKHLGHIAVAEVQTLKLYYMLVSKIQQQNIWLRG